MDRELTIPERDLVVALCNWLAQEMQDRLREEDEHPDLYWDYGAGMFSKTCEALAHVGIFKSDPTGVWRHVVPISNIGTHFQNRPLQNSDMVILADAMASHGGCFYPSTTEPISTETLDEYPKFALACIGLEQCGIMNIADDGSYFWTKDAYNTFRIAQYA
jgi:hypothetical protein